MTQEPTVQPSAELRHIVWDWNGTLLDDTPLTVRAAVAALQAIGHPQSLDLRQWRRIATRPLTEVYTHLVDGPISAPQWETIERVWLSVYLQGLPDIGLNPLAWAALDEAADRGMSGSIVSLHKQGELRAHVAALGLADRFTHISGTCIDDTWAGARPSKAAAIRMQLDELGVAPDQALMIGDMEDDAREAAAAGTAVVLVPTGDTSRERLIASGYPVAESLLDAVRGVLLDR